MSLKSTFKKVKSGVKSAVTAVKKVSSFVAKVADSKLVNAAISLIPAASIAKMTVKAVTAGVVDKAKVAETLISNGVPVTESNIATVTKAIQQKATQEHSVELGSVEKVQKVSNDSSNPKNDLGMWEKFKAWYDKNSSWFVPVAVVVAIAIAVGSYFLFGKKRRS